MSLSPSLRPVVAAAILLGLAAGCSKAPVEAAPPHAHHHHAPHGGTPVEIGDEAYHLELVLDEVTGTLQAYVLDAEMEDFVRSPDHALEITVTSGGASHVIALAAVANPETGETVGDTSLYQAQADWLKATPRFEGVLGSVTIRGTTFTHVAFSFPKGNDSSP
jgi:hypothetical protein